MQLKTLKGSFDVAYQRAKAGAPKHPNDMMDELFGESAVMKRMKQSEFERRLKDEDDFRATTGGPHAKQ